MNPALLGELINEILVKSKILGSSDQSFIPGLTPRQIHMILKIGTEIYKHGQLANKLGVDPSTLSRTLQPLIKVGIIYRKQNPLSRREILIQLSPKGLEVLDEIKEKINEICLQILEQVPKQQKEMIETSLLLLLDILKNTELKHS
ncbi:DNA-binding transcriptional regulator, MarR family [Seinonella peptonophila]|uniref:DNA-binding transcriptional regulator, MarR family n=1 Tax=Seinonella peptonophila TaxID=112248 RepID=A0A1M4WNI7_9BACL|nr:MarR family transcriptional regulator [Seinonella peptonophila]SHE82747.1 DNA-binding transcriptional regulator, MarR family [Seinonella peptonophila]